MGAPVFFDAINLHFSFHLFLVAGEVSPYAAMPTGIRRYPLCGGIPRTPNQKMCTSTCDKLSKNHNSDIFQNVASLTLQNIFSIQD